MATQPCIRNAKLTMFQIYTSASETRVWSCMQALLQIGSFVFNNVETIYVKFATSSYTTPFTELWKIVSNSWQRSLLVYAINGSRMCAQHECWIFVSKNWTKLKHNYLFCTEFLEEIWYHYSNIPHHIPCKLDQELYSICRSLWYLLKINTLPTGIGPS